jgi:hypothetical protein
MKTMVQPLLNHIHGKRKVGGQNLFGNQVEKRFGCSCDATKYGRKAKICTFFDDYFGSAI